MEPLKVEYWDPLYYHSLCYLRPTASLTIAMQMTSQYLSVKDLSGCYQGMDVTQIQIGPNKLAH